MNKISDRTGGQIEGYQAIYQYGGVPVCFPEKRSNVLQQILLIEGRIETFGKENKGWVLRLDGLSFSGDLGVLRASCCGVFQGSPATLSGINPYISIGWAPLEASLLVSMTPGKKEP